MSIWKRRLEQDLDKDTSEDPFYHEEEKRGRKKSGKDYSNDNYSGGRRGKNRETSDGTLPKFRP